MRSPGRPHATSYATAEVLDAVASPDPAIEVPATRYLDFTKIGAAQTDRRRRRRPGVRSIFQDISPRVRPRPDESRDGRQCAGRPAHSPDLARHRTQRARRRPRRRARVTTDICLTPIVVASGERVEAHFRPLRLRVCAAFTERATAAPACRRRPPAPCPGNSWTRRSQDRGTHRPSPPACPAASSASADRPSRDRRIGSARKRPSALR